MGAGSGSNFQPAHVSSGSSDEDGLEGPGGSHPQSYIDAEYDEDVSNIADEYYQNCLTFESPTDILYDELPPRSSDTKSTSSSIITVEAEGSDVEESRSHRKSHHVSPSWEQSQGRRKSSMASKRSNGYLRSMPPTNFRSSRDARRRTTNTVKFEDLEGEGSGSDVFVGKEHLGCFEHTKPVVYEPPVSSDPYDNNEHLVETLSILQKEEHIPEIALGSHGTPGLHLAWTSKRQTYGSIQTELLVVNSAENFTFGSDNSVVTLYCQNEALDDKDNRNPQQISWLHVQHSSKITNTIKNLVRNCPLIDLSYVSIALKLLSKALPPETEIQQNDIHHQTRPIVLRSDGESHALEPKSVTFISAPYLIFRKQQIRHTSVDMMQTLLNSHYGLGRKSQVPVLSETQKWLEEEIIHVAQMRVLLIGPGVLLTWGELPSAAIRKNNIRVNNTGTRPLITVRITDLRDKIYYSYVKHNMSFAELSARIIGLTKAENFYIRESGFPGSMVTPELWVGLLRKASDQFCDVHLSLCHRLGDASRGRIRRYNSQKFAHQPRGNSQGAHSFTSKVSPVVSGRALQLWRRHSTHSQQRHPQFTRTSPPPDTACVRRTPSEGELDTKLHQTSWLKAMRKKAFGKGLLNNDRPSQTYHLSSSENEDEAPKTQRGPFYASPARQSSRPSLSEGSLSASKAGQEAGSNAMALTIYNSKPARECERPETARSDQREEITLELESPSSETKPFLLWRVTKGNQENNDEGNFGTMSRLIGKVQLSLQTSPRFGFRYKKAHRCSMESLCIRYEALTEVTCPSIAAQSSATDESRNRPSPVIESIDFNPELDEKLTPVLNEKNQLIRDIFNLSKTLLAYFVPLSEVATHAEVAHVLNRYWGALDQSFRHLLFAAQSRNSYNEQTWKVKGSYYLSGGYATSQERPSLQDEKKYSLLGALEYLHTNIPVSQRHGVVTPDDDPCTVWLENTKAPERLSRFNKLREALGEFCSDLKEISDFSKELHLYVFRPGDKADEPEENQSKGKSGGKNENSRAGKANRQDNSDEKLAAVDDSRPLHTPKENNTESLGSFPNTPALPVSLFKAFENIIALFGLQSQNIEAKAREPECDTSPRQHATLVKQDYIAARKRVMSCLERSKNDLILNLLTQNNKSIGLGRVGSEYIAAMIVSNTQMGVFHLGTGSSKVPENLSTIGGGVYQGKRKRTAILWTEMLDQHGRMHCIPETLGEKPNTQVKSLDYLALYTEHARALGFSASIDPRRRAFLAIRAVDEDLKAIRGICEMQQHCLENMVRIADPESFRVVSREREARFLQEKALLGRLKAAKKREMRDVEDIRRGLADLRLAVIESIEVLDEGHGKAIRVFTLVTLFFLPLSFVTSFFGMNAADIRDMAAGSSLYWSIAAPLTLSVLGLAYLYGYKWEAVARHITQRTWLQRGLAHADGYPDSASRGRAEDRRAQIWYRALRRRRGTMRSTESYGRRGTAVTEDWAMAEP